LAGHERASPDFELIRQSERLEEAVWRGVISAAPPAKAPTAPGGTRNHEVNP
jgi:hypothetical protein